MAPSYLRTDASIITSFTARDSQNVIKENIYSYKGKISIDITNAFNAWKTMVQRNLFLCIHLLILTQYKPIPKRVFFFFLFCFVFCFFFFFFFWGSLQFQIWGFPELWIHQFATCSRTSAGNFLNTWRKFFSLKALNMISALAIYSIENNYKCMWKMDVSSNSWFFLLSHHFMLGFINCSCEK